MLSRTLGGTIVRKTRDTLTILLETGCKVTYTDKGTTLELGDQCHVAFNEVTDKVVRLYSYKEFSIDHNIIPPHREYYPSHEELGEILGDRDCEESFEDWE